MELVKTFDEYKFAEAGESLKLLEYLHEKFFAINKNHPNEFSNAKTIVDDLLNGMELTEPDQGYVCGAAINYSSESGVKRLIVLKGTRLETAVKKFMNLKDNPSS